MLENSIKETARDAASKAVYELLGMDHEPTTALLAATVREILLRIDTVCTITGLSVPSIYRLMSQGKFPRPLKITNHARAWKLSEVMAWIDRCGREGG